MKGAKVNPMTMHAAKGLELMKLLPGGKKVFSYQKSLEEKDFALEEERRLAYVGITRERKKHFYL